MDQSANSGGQGGGGIVGSWGQLILQWGQGNKALGYKHEHLLLSGLMLLSIFFKIGC